MANCRRLVVHPILVFLLLLSAVLYSPSFSQDDSSIVFLGQVPFRAYVSRGVPPLRTLYQFFAVHSLTLLSDGITYSVAAGEDLGGVDFFINADTGQLFSRNYFPQFGPTSYELTVKAMSSLGEWTETAHLIIYITPESDTTPRYEHSQYTIEIPEDMQATLPLLAVQAFSLNPKSFRALYGIVDGNVDGDFAITSHNGLLRVQRELDRERTGSYVLTVRYVDDFSSVDTTVCISILDINDNTPQFTEVLYNVTIPENTAVNSVILNISATDPDFESRGRLNYALNSSMFSLDSLTGEVRLNLTTIDYEIQRQYQFNVIAMDEGEPPLSSQATIFVNVANIDDECPRFDSPVYIRELPYDPDNEMVPTTGMEVLTVMAIDPDKISDVVYSIASGNDEEVLTLDPNTGVISLTNLASNDPRGQYNIIVYASDASCINHSSVRVEVGIGNVNEHSPSFQGACEASIPENPPMGTIVTSLLATDGDSGINGDVKYAFNTPHELFTINPSNGEVQTTQPAESYDRETQALFQISVTATDGGHRQDYCLLTIILEDVNDNAPMFQLDVTEYQTSLALDAPLNTFILQVHAEDIDLGNNGTIDYSIEYIDQSQGFSVEISQSGVITTNSIIPLSLSPIAFLAMATDRGSPSLSSSVEVTVSITNGNLIPVFQQQNYSVTLCENAAPMTLVSIVNASTADTTDLDFVIYDAPEGTDYQSNQNGIFGVTVDGEVMVTANGHIDYELLPAGRKSFIFFVSAVNSDGRSLTLIEVTVLDYNDNPPELSPILSLAIAENEPIGTTLTRLQASDPDSGTNGEIAYRLEGSSNHFNVNPNGIITTKMEFNAEDPPPAADLSLIITAFNPNPSIDTSGLCPNGTSGESRTLVKVLLLDQNDNPPTFNQSQVSLTLREDYQVASTVYTFEASDPDSSDQEQLSYSITDGNIGVAFEIFNTGLLTLAQRLDYEAVTAYMLQVQVTDGLHTDTATISITIMNIDDEPPVFTSASYFAQIIENTPLGSLVLTVEATDPDSASVSYSLKGLAIGRFSIGNDGRIVVSGPVDREEFSGGTVKFLVFAEGGRLATANVEVNILDINDYHPRFLPPLNGQVTENRQPEDTGLLVMTVTAIDLDEGVNGTLTYALISDPQSGFQIDSITGDITAHREYDRESTPSFVLVVIAMDNGVVIQLNSTAEVVIYIGDVDDNEPFFLYPYMFVRIFEGSPIHTPVIYIPALDPDNGDNALITFFLESTSPNMVKYDLNSTTGEITVVSPLDYGTIQDRLYSLCLSLENGSNVQGKLDIELLDRNNHSPQVTESVLPFGNSIPENSPVETILARISASDGDEGSNGKLVFNITAGDPDSDFRLNVEEGMGIVRVVALDRERRSSYSLEIAISDSGCPVRSTTFELHFTITDVNDMAPKFVQDSYTGSVVENEGPVGSILKVNATDPDTEDGGMISSYQILSGDPDRNFTLDNQTGILGSVMSLDREEKSDYLLTIVAVDGGLVPLTGTTTAVITVTDVDDNPPRSGGEMELHIVAPNGQLTAGEIAPVFFIDPDSESLLQNCNVFNKVSATQFDANERCYITTAVNPPEQMVRFGITGSDGVHGAITTYANLTVEYIPNVSLMPEFLVTITLNIAPSDYLSSGTSVFPLMLTSVLGISMSQLTILSVQAGYHDAETTTDVTLSVQSDGLLLRPAAIVQDIYLQRAALLASGFPLLALPTDPCVTEPCMNEAACTITTSIGETQILARSSTGNVVFYGPRINLGYQCECVPGTSGHDCEVNYNDCYSNPCLYGAKCSDGVNGHVCDCPEGTGGVDCSFNPDECTSSPCQNGATCFNGLGSYECVCPLGYYGRECQYQYFQPSSYCNSNPCLNGAECSPGRDSFTCLCPRGFTGDRCQDAVLIQGGCTGNPCYNGSTCIGTSDGYTCICSVGFTGPHCRWPLNNCELEPCKNGGHCLAGFYGSHQCICPSGLTGEDCSSIIPACDASPCLNEGRCLDIEGGFHTCECTREFRGTNCEFPLQVDNLCSSNPCHNVSICTSGREAFTCSCPANYTGSDCSLESASLDPCGSNPCQYGSTCLPQQDTMTNYSCVCSDGFEGRNCELNIDDCDPNPCQNGGTCQDKIAGFICNCPEEIAGRVCDVFCPFGHRGDFCEISPQYCDPNPCNNDGICTVNANLAGYTCSCLPGFTGTTCDVAVQCQSSLCLNGGSCISVSGGGIRCECQSGYNGDHCELQVVSFSGSQNQSSYRAFDSLQIRGQGSLSFQFATLDSEALLLYNTQYQFGTSRDHLAVAITGGNLQLMVSHGEDGGAGVMVVSRAVRVNDGLWHDVLIESSGTVSMCIHLFVHMYMCAICTYNIYAELLGSRNCPYSYSNLLTDYRHRTHKYGCNIVYL